MVYARWLPALAILALTAGAVHAERGDWRGYELKSYGARVAYPAAIFDPLDSERPGMQSFAARGEEARFLIGAWHNDKGHSPSQFRRFVLGKRADYRGLTYGPRGRDWFVLSGYSGDEIYYEKVMFSCNRRMISVLAITYPIARRHAYDPLVERMEDAFRPATRDDRGRHCG